MTEQDTQTQEAASVQTEEAQLENLKADEHESIKKINPDLDVILDIPVTLSMEVGKTQIPIKNLLKLNQGSIIELDKASGEQMDVLVNGTLIAKGEVIIVHDKFGIRLTDVVNPHERLSSVACES